MTSLVRCVLSATMPLTPMAVMTLPKALCAQHRADADTILMVGNKIPTLSGTDQLGVKSAILRISKGPMA